MTQGASGRMEAFPPTRARAGGKEGTVAQPGWLWCFSCPEAWWQAFASVAWGHSAVKRFAGWGPVRPARAGVHSSLCSRARGPPPPPRCRFAQGEGRDVARNSGECSKLSCAQNKSYHFLQQLCRSVYEWALLVDTDDWPESLSYLLRFVAMLGPQMQMQEPACLGGQNDSRWNVLAKPLQRMASVLCKKPVASGRRGIPHTSAHATA
eukprot:gene25743-biopygen6026